MHDQVFARLYNQVMLNRAYMKTILANQCIIMANQTKKSISHKALYEKIHGEVFQQFKKIINEDRHAVIDHKEKKK